MKLKNNGIVKERKFLWSYSSSILVTMLVWSSIWTFCSTQWWQAFIISLAFGAISMIITVKSIKKDYPLLYKRHDERTLVWSLAIGISISLIASLLSYLFFNKVDVKTAYISVFAGIFSIRMAKWCIKIRDSISHQSN